MEGLTKRELFAAMAMQGMCANPTVLEGEIHDLVYDSVQIADALLRKLEEGK